MKRLILLIAVLAVLFTSCNKNMDENHIPVEDKTMNDLVVDESFDWKTTMDIEVLLSGPIRSAVFINSTDGDNYHKGLLFPGTEYKTKITVPNYITEVELRYDGQVYKLALENKKIEYTFN
ncbi:MAG: hypothetical protein QM503_09360 [Bacteroidota bacterium]